jgi:D-tyrosyl-tRNA(Tyr) deacylase
MLPVMIGLLQRVSEASVRVGEELVGQIGAGLLVLVAVERGDTPAQAQRLAERLVAYRVFEDADGKMNRDVREADGGLLLVPQFTLAADTRKGNRPSFSGAADPASGRELFECLAREVARLCPRVATGRFGAHMAVSLVNDGPVTVSLRVLPAEAGPAGGLAGRHAESTECGRG